MPLPLPRHRCILAFQQAKQRNKATCENGNKGIKQANSSKIIVILHDFQEKLIILQTTHSKRTIWNKRLTISRLPL